MTFRHRAGVSPYTSLYSFAETCVFGKQSFGPFLCNLSLRCYSHKRPHFSRSYVCILPSSLTRVLSHALEYSSRLPVSVCGTVPDKRPLEIISRRHDYARFACPKTGSLSQLILSCGFACRTQKLAAWTGIPTTGRGSPHASSLRHLLSEVLEYKPVSHRLRFSASP